MSAVEQLESMFAAQGARVVGAFVYWSLEGVHLEREDWRAKMSELGLERAVGRSPKAEALLSSSISAVQSGAAADGVLFRRMGRAEHALIVETRQKTGAGEQLVHEHVATAHVGEAGLALRQLLGAEAYERAERVYRKLATEYEDRRAYLGTSELSQQMVFAMQGSTTRPLLGAISLRERTGGLYLVPSASVPTAKALAELVNERTRSHVSVLTLYGDADNLAEAARTAKQSFVAQLRELKDELEAFAKSCADNDKDATEFNVDNRIAKLNVLGARVDLWQDILGDARDELRAQIDVARAGVAKALGL